MSIISGAWWLARALGLASGLGRFANPALLAAVAVALLLSLAAAGAGLIWRQASGAAEARCETRFASARERLTEAREKFLLLQIKARDLRLVERGRMLETTATALETERQQSEALRERLSNLDDDIWLHAEWLRRQRAAPGKPRTGRR